MPRRAIVVGSGPNGLTAAVLLARAGLEVTVFEANETIGGGTRSAELTLPGFTHDICSAIHPMGVASPIFRELGLEREGLSWIQPTPLAHPLGGTQVAILERSLDATVQGLGADGAAYRKLIAPLVEKGQPLMDALLGPLLPPRHPIMLARFGMNGLRSADGLARAAAMGRATRPS